MPTTPACDLAGCFKPAGEHEIEFAIGTRVIDDRPVDLRRRLRICDDHYAFICQGVIESISIAADGTATGVITGPAKPVSIYPPAELR